MGDGVVDGVTNDTADDGTYPALTKTSEPLGTATLVPSVVALIGVASAFGSTPGKGGGAAPVAAGKLLTGTPDAPPPPVG